MLICVQLFATPWTLACQAPLSMEFSRQEYWSGFSSPGDLPNPGIEPRCPALQVDSLPSEPPEKPRNTGVSWKTGAYPFSRGLSQPRIKAESPALLVDSLSPELPRSPSRREARVKLSISSLCRVFFRIKFSCCDQDPKLSRLYSHPGTQGK